MYLLFYKLKYKRYNYQTIFTITIFFAVLMIGVLNVVIFNTNYMMVFAKYSSEMPFEDEILSILVEKVYNNFNSFIMSFIFAIYFPFLQSIQLLVKRSKSPFKDNSDVT